LPKCHWPTYPSKKAMPLALALVALTIVAGCGPRRVIVACYEGQRRPAAPSGGELHLGASLIPERCTSYETSGLVIDVQPGMRLPVELQLTR